VRTIGLRARALAVAALLAGAGLGAAKGATVEKDKFDSLYARWQAHIAEPKVKFSSRPNAYADGPAYRGIVGLGRKALPRVIEKLRQGAATGWKESQFFLWRAAKEISGVDLSKGEHGVSEQEMARRYVEWFDKTHK
jgi:hypothetical protein